MLEIDENLVRDELTALERAEQLKRRKEIYEARHPEAKAGIKRAAGMNKSLGRDVAEIISATSFTADTAAKVGVTDRSIRQDVQIAERIAAPVRAAIAGTPPAVHHVATEAHSGRSTSPGGRGPTRRARRADRRAGRTARII